MTDKPRIPCAPPASPQGATSDEPLLEQADKAGLRKALMATRRTLEPALRAHWDERIGHQVLAWWRTHQPAALGVYWPMHGEPDLRLAYAELAEAGVQLVLPVVVARDAPLAFADWTPGEILVRDGMGVAVPGDLRMAPRPPALLVPCLGFNANRYRLGYGGGYYDRTLAPEPRPATAGIAYSVLQAEFEGAPHDIALDLIITEASEPV